MLARHIGFALAAGRFLSIWSAEAQFDPPLPESPPDVISDLGVVTATVVAPTILRSRCLPIDAGGRMVRDRDRSSDPLGSGRRRRATPGQGTLLAPRRAPTSGADASDSSSAPVPSPQQRRRRGRRPNGAREPFALRPDADWRDNSSWRNGAVRSAPKRNPRTLRWPHPGVDQVPRSHCVARPGPKGGVQSLGTARQGEPLVTSGS